MTMCKPCPANTYSAYPATSKEACQCKKGYYSQYYNTTLKKTTPGTECVSCNDLVESPRKDQICGEHPIVSKSGMCDVPFTTVCVAPTPGVMFFSVCRVYCPGGTQWPKAKSQFYTIGTIALNPAEVREGGIAKFKPDTVPCAPPEACLSWNVCQYKHRGFSCGSCIFGYFTDDKSKKCVACGAAQRVGWII